MYLCMYRNQEENLKSTKHTQLPIMPTDCQIDQQHHSTDPNGTAAPLGVCMDSHRQSPQIIGEPPDGDDTDPDVIPNQYGKYLLTSVNVQNFV